MQYPGLGFPALLSVPPISSVPSPASYHRAAASRPFYSRRVPHRFAGSPGTSPVPFARDDNQWHLAIGPNKDNLGVPLRLEIFGQHV